MFATDDPQFEEVLQLTQLAVGPGFTDAQRARWRALCAGMLGTLQSAGQQAPERRRMLRAIASLPVDVLSPEQLRGTRLTSSVSAGGLSLPARGQPPLGTLVEVSIAVAERPQPILARGSVCWANGEDIGLAFIDLIQSERELLEAIAVQALLAYAALE